ncbi:hypothetical protein K3495_g7158 [Podosphaera aphanis]|nr:hypothetical protein K3495_g7158 [Podosphaera aphanis]
MQIFKVSNSVESFFIFHIYHKKSNRDGISQTTLQRFYQAKIQVDKPFLLLGDLNLHHPCWNPMIQSPSPQATELHDYLRKNRARLLLDSEVIEELAISEKDADKVAALQEIILKAAEDPIPKSKPSSCSKSWWNEELTNLRREYHSAKRKAKKSWLQEDLESARIKRNHYFRSISSIKKQHWEKFLAEAKDKRFFKAYSYSNPKHSQNSLIPTLKHLSSQGEEIVATSFADKCEALIYNLFPKADADADSQTFSHGNPYTSVSDPFLSPRSTSDPFYPLEEIIQAVPDKKTAPGWDDID